MYFDIDALTEFNRFQIKNKFDFWLKVQINITLLYSQVFPGILTKNCVFLSRHAVDNIVNFKTRCFKSYKNQDTKMVIAIRFHTFTVVIVPISSISRIKKLNLFDSASSCRPGQNRRRKMSENYFGTSVYRKDNNISSK